MIVRLRPTNTTTDDYSRRPVPDWGGPVSRLPLRSAQFAPSTADEQEQGRPVLEAGLLYDVAPGMLTEVDHVEVDGIEWEVTGAPATGWRHPLYGGRRGGVVKIVRYR